MGKYIDKSALVAEIEKRIEGINPLSQRVGVVGCSNTIKHLRGILSFLDTLEVKEINNVWHDARRTIPEDGSEQIICIKEDGLAVSTIGKIVNGTIKWAYLNDLLNISDVQVKEVEEEPVSSIWHDASEKSNEPEDIVIINPSDNTGEVLTKCTGVYQGRIWAYTSVLLKLDNPCKIGKNLQEEPISNGIEEEFVLYLKHKFNIPQEGHKLKTDGWRLSPYDILDIAKHFAQWQKEQMEKNRIEHCDNITEEQYNLETGFLDSFLDKNKRMPTFLDAIEYGMQKSQKGG